MIQRENGIKDDCCNLTINRVDNGGIEGSGSIRFFNAAGVEIVRIFFDLPAFSTAFFGVATANNLPRSNTSIGTDEIGVRFDIIDRDNNFCWGGTLGLISDNPLPDLVVSSVNFTANTLVRIEAPFTYTEP
jgi:hypothetical protein